MRRPLLLLPALLPAAAHAQTTNNAVAAAEDAFGTVVGHEQIGIYDEGNVRGFNPGSAGNFRMEGMYFDIEGGLGNRILDGETIHVGPSVQGFAFPAPTGVVDLALKKVGDKRTITPFLSTDSFGSLGFELDAALPLNGKELGLATGLGLSRNHFANGGENKGFTFGAVPHWKPSKNVELTAFYNWQQFSDETTQAIFIPTGNFLPAPIARGIYPGPDWARSDSRSETFGLVGRASSDGWTLRGGLFHSRYRQNRGFANLVYLGADQSTDRQVTGYPGSGAASWSGEARLIRLIAEGPRQHRLMIALRDRAIDAVYGGGDTQDLGPSRLNAPFSAAEPQFNFGPQVDDRTRQATIGGAYSLAWKGLGSLTAGLQRTHYIKRVGLIGTDLARGSSSATLPYFSAAASLSPTLSLYGSSVRGLEDAGSAPGFAANANQVLPAIRTSQYDFGLRWAPGKGTTLILGWFHITKPYIDLDKANIYGVLGAETHEGAELSLTSDLTHNLRVVGGGVLQRPSVVASPTIAQVVGKRPVGQSDLRTRLNLTWTLPYAPALTLDAYVNHDSGSAATVDNTLNAPGSTRYGGGARYKFALGGKQLTARIELYNLSDVYRIVPFGSGVYGAITQRNLQAWITTEL